MTSLEKDQVYGILAPVVVIRLVEVGNRMGLKFSNGVSMILYICNNMAMIERASNANGKCFVLIMLTTRYLIGMAVAKRSNGMNCEDCKFGEDKSETIPQNKIQFSSQRKKSKNSNLT